MCSRGLTLGTAPRKEDHIDKNSPVVSHGRVFVPFHTFKRMIVGGCGTAVRWRFV